MGNIFSAVGGTGEIVQTGVTGLLVTPGGVGDIGRALSWVLDNEDEARQMAEVCRKRTLELFTWDTIIDEYCKLLESIYKNNPKRY